MEPQRIYHNRTLLDQTHAIVSQDLYVYDQITHELNQRILPRIAENVYNCDEILRDRNPSRFDKAALLHCIRKTLETIESITVNIDGLFVSDTHDEYINDTREYARDTNNRGMVLRFSTNFRKRYTKRTQRDDFAPPFDTYFMNLNEFIKKPCGIFAPNGIYQFTDFPRYLLNHIEDTNPGLDQDNKINKMIKTLHTAYIDGYMAFIQHMPKKYLIDVLKRFYRVLNKVSSDLRRDPRMYLEEMYYEPSEESISDDDEDAWRQLEEQFFPPDDE